jgi:hypothetical protein
MESAVIYKFDMISNEFNECYNLNNPDWVLSDTKKEVNETLKLTTNNSVQIIKNEFDSNIIA